MNRAMADDPSGSLEKIRAIGKGEQP